MAIRIVTILSNVEGPRLATVALPMIIGAVSEWLMEGVL